MKREISSFNQNTQFHGAHFESIHHDQARTNESQPVTPTTSLSSIGDLLDPIGDPVDLVGDLVALVPLHKQMEPKIGIQIAQPQVSLAKMHCR